MQASMHRSTHRALYRRPNFLLMCLTLGSVFFIDFMLLGLSLHTEGPISSPLYSLHILLIAIGSLALVRLITELDEAQAPASPITADGRVGDDAAGMRVSHQQIWSWAMIGLGFIASTIFLISPQLFTYLALEDGIVETFSALGYFVGVGLLIAASLGLRGYRGPYGRLWLPILLGGALVLFVMGGEEISWGQRIFHIATPAAFAGNHQGEMNVHNFASDIIQTLIYSLAALWLMIIPFIHQRTGLFAKLRPIMIFMPAPYLIFIGAITTVYYHIHWEWYTEPFQFYFFMSLFVLLSYSAGGASSAKSTSNRLMIVALLVLMVASQVIFISFKDSFGRSWDLTEYRELFIPLGYMVYCLDVYLRVRRSKRAAATAAG